MSLMNFKGFLTKTSRDFCSSAGAVIVSVSALLLVTSCSSYDLGSKAPIAVTVDTASPTWENGIENLVAKKCDNCHAKSTSKFVPGEIRDDKDRLAVGFSESEDRFLSYGSLSYNRVFNDPSDPMPPNYGTPLNDSEKAALKTYLETKVINVSEDRNKIAADACVGVSGGGSLKFASDAEPVYTSQCASCHSTATGVGGLDLSSAAQWKSNKVDLIYVLTTKSAGNKMPPGRADGYTAAGNTGAVLLNYLCTSTEVN
jgi:cytochrome c5